MFNARKTYFHGKSSQYSRERNKKIAIFLHSVGRRIIKCRESVVLKKALLYCRLPQTGNSFKISPKWSSLWYLHWLVWYSFVWMMSQTPCNYLNYDMVKVKIVIFREKTSFFFREIEDDTCILLFFYFSNNRLIFWYKGNCLTTIHYSRKKTNSHMVGRFASLEKSAGRIISKNQLFCVFWCFCTKYFSQMAL